MDAQTAGSLLEFAERADTGLKGLEVQSLLAEVERRYADVLLALQWFIDAGQPDGALRLVSALTYFWRATGRMGEAAAWCDRALATPGGDDSRRGQALHDAGLIAFFAGNEERAGSLYERALEMGRRIGDPTVVALALVGQARMALRTEVEPARRLCREAITVTEGTADRIGRSAAMHVLAVAAQMAGDLAQARTLMNERMALGRELGNYLIVSTECGNLSMVERQLGNLDRAEALAREALTINGQRGDEWAIPYALNGIAAVAMERRDHERAAKLLGAAEAMLQAQGAAWPPDEQPQYERMVKVLDGAMGTAAFERARNAGRSMTTQESVRFALN